MFLALKRITSLHTNRLKILLDSYVFTKKIIRHELKAWKF